MMRVGIKSFYILKTPFDPVRDALLEWSCNPVRSQQHTFYNHSHISILKRSQTRCLMHSTISFRSRKIGYLSGPQSFEKQDHNLFYDNMVPHNEGLRAKRSHVLGARASPNAKTSGE